MSSDQRDKREMYTEIGALIGSIAEAFSISEEEAVSAVEGNRVAMALGRDSNGNPFVAATYDGRTARIYQGAIKRETGKPAAG